MQEKGPTNFNFLFWLLLDSHVTGTRNSLIQNRLSIYLLSDAYSSLCI